jgi:peptide/nickel transport system permease protein
VIVVPPLYPRMLRWLRANPGAGIGLGLVITMVAACVLAPVLAPHDPNAVGLGPARTAPGAAFWLGTDEVGRDGLSRLLYGARISLPIGLLAVAIAAVVGGGVGGMAGYVGGRTDRLILWLVDLLMALPRLVLLMAIVAVLGRMQEGRVLVIAAVLGLTGWMPVARVVRAEVLSLRQRPFVLAARSLGLPGGRILVRHVLPNALTPLIVHASLMIGSTILLEAALSFLGLGVPLPAPSWGAMIGSGMHHMDAWWLSVFPGLAIALTVLGFNLLGDGLRATLTPPPE